jgi:hypothetical protein
MPHIRVSESETLDAKRIHSFKASDDDAGEKVLTLTKEDGAEVILRGELADNALAILRLHGF